MRNNRRMQGRMRAGSRNRDLRHGVGMGLTTLILPQSVSLWSPKAGIKRIDVIPYEVGKGNPYADEGTWYYERTYWVHRNVGVNDSTYVCPAKSINQPCPICEVRSKMVRDPAADKDVVRSLKPKERQLFLIYDHDEKEKGVQIWDVSYFGFGSLLDDYRRDADESERHITDFDDYQAGSTLRVSFKEESIGSNSFLKAFRIDFKPRQAPLDESLLDHGICLDKLLKILSYDQLKAVFEQADLQEEEDQKDLDKEDEPEPFVNKENGSTDEKDPFLWDE